MGRTLMAAEYRSRRSPRAEASARASRPASRVAGVGGRASVGVGVGRRRDGASAVAVASTASGASAAWPWLRRGCSGPAQSRDFSASLPLASAVASPALRASGAALSAAVAATRRPWRRTRGRSGWRARRGRRWLRGADSRIVGRRWLRRRRRRPCRTMPFVPPRSPASSGRGVGASLAWAFDRLVVVRGGRVGHGGVLLWVGASSHERVRSSRENPTAVGVSSARRTIQRSGRPGWRTCHGRRVDLRRPRARAARACVDEAERTLDTDVVMAYAPSAVGHGRSRDGDADGLHPVELELEPARVPAGPRAAWSAASLVAYRRDAD